MIDKLLYECSTLEELDNIYDRYVKVYHDEMGKHLRELDQTPKSKRLARHSPKPYWSDHLTELWQTCHEAEKLYERADSRSPGYIGLKDRSNFLYRKLNRDIKKARRNFERKKSMTSKRRTLIIQLSFGI